MATIVSPAPGAPATPPAPARVAAADRSAIPLRLAAILVGAFAVFGIFGRAYLIVAGWATPRSNIHIFPRLYALHEQPFLLLLLLFAVLVGVASALKAPRVEAPWLARLAEGWARVPVWALALAVLAATGAGTLGVMHGIGLSMDEFAASFQARLFAAGQLTAHIPREWQPIAAWLKPIFITYKPATQEWVANYLPVYAALRALFALVGAEWLTNPALAAASVLLLDAVARRLWPGDDSRRVLALAFLVTSSQFVIMSMTAYSMPAHLCFDLLWLWLYLRDDRAGYLALPWVGVLAMGLHNPFPHALFVTPFLVRLLRERRFGWLVYLGVVYLAGAEVWLRWLAFSTSTGVSASDGANAAGLLSSFALPNAMLQFVHGLNATLVFSWQTPVLAVLLLVALLSWRSLGRVERDLAAGLLVTFGFYLLFPSDQGHGWGYRYIYGVLGNVMLLGATGAALAARRLRAPVLRTLLAASFVASVAWQLPLRALQAEAFVRPFATTLEAIARDPAPLVAVDYSQAWYGTDLIRNDPLFTRGPRVMYFNDRWAPLATILPPALLARTSVISRPQFARFGMTLLPQRVPASAGKR